MSPGRECPYCEKHLPVLIEDDDYRLSLAVHFLKCVAAPRDLTPTDAMEAAAAIVAAENDRQPDA